MAHLKDSKLITLVRTLSEDEHKKLKLWLQSPWANSNKNLIRLHKTIYKHSPDFIHLDLEKVNVFKKLYRGKKYDNKSLNNLISEFIKRLEQFLCHQRIHTDPILQNDLLRQEMQERQLPNFFEQLTRQLIRTLDKQNIKTAEQHWQLSKLYRQLYYQPAEHHRYFSDQPILDKSDFHLNAFYALTKYQLLHEAKDSRAILKKKSKLTGDLNFLAILKDSLPIPALQLYQMRLLRSADFTKTDYLLFKEQYYKSFTELSPEHQRDFFFFCINDTVILNVKGNKNSMEESLELYKYGLKHKLLFEYDMLSAITFNNILMAASHLNEVAFAKKFVSKYASFLHPDVQEDAKAWSKGQLNFITGDYQKSMVLLKDYKFQNLLFQIQSRVTLVKVYYKLAAADPTIFETLSSYYIASIKFLRRNKLLSENRSNSYIRFIQFTSRLADIQQKNGSHLNKRQKIASEIAKEKNLIGKHWLQKQLNFISA